MAGNREGFEGWAILELMGHRRLGGYLTEQEIAGAAFIRIDIPEHPWRAGCTCGSAKPESTSYEDHTHVCQAFRDPADDRPLDVAATQLYAPAAVYCVTPTTEQLARVAAASSKPEPVTEWEARWARPAIAPAPSIEDAVEEHLDELDQEHENRELEQESEQDDRIPF